MPVYYEEIFGPVVGLTTFNSTGEAIETANNTICGLGTGDCSRYAYELFQVPKAIHAVRVWLNQYNTYPSQTSFGGVKKSGFGRYHDKLALDNYRKVKTCWFLTLNKQLVSFDQH